MTALKSELKIDVFGSPPTQNQINAWKNEIKGQLSLAEKMVIFSPSLILGAVGAVAVTCIQGDPIAPTQPDYEAFNKDWNKDEVAQKYVEQVRATERYLINAEVKALTDHINKVNLFENLSQTAIHVLKKQIKKELNLK